MNLLEAEKQIAHILAKLEKETSQIVDSVEINKIDVTCFEDDRPRHKCAVRIITHRLPGNGWSI